MKQAALIIVIALLGPCAALSQERGGAAAVADGAKQPARGDGVPIEQVIAAVAKKSGKKFIVDNRVNGNVEILGQEVAAVSYGDLLSILLLNGYTAFEGSNYITVIPVNSIRDEPLPLVTGKENLPDAQFVTMVIPVKYVMAAGLVPLLRPLLPTYGHLAALPCANLLVVVDNFANVKRIEKLVFAMDIGKQLYLAPSCDGESSHSSASAAK